MNSDYGRRFGLIVAQKKPIFNMKLPCYNCPFRNDKIFPLTKARRLDIAAVLFADADFPCHKTFAEIEDYEANPGLSKRCTGAAIWLENSRPGGLRSNFVFRLALMFKEFRLEQLDMNAPVCQTREEFENLYDL